VRRDEAIRSSIKVLVNGGEKKKGKKQRERERERERREIRERSGLALR